MNDLYKLVPRDLERNIRWRLFVLEKAAKNPELQQALRVYCSADIIFYVSTFVWQCNPKARGADQKVGPFIPWPYQIRGILGDGGILWCIKNGEDLVVEKSREMGITWVFLFCMDWLCRFQAYHDSILISKSAKAVDDSSRQSLFGKLRFIHEHLPAWMHDPDPYKSIDNKNVLIYDKTKATVTGQASTGRAGVSERCTEMFIDEYPQIEEDWEVLYRTASTTNCRLFNGTHLGTGTALYSLTQRDDIKKLRFHWTQHPKKNAGLYRYNQHKNGLDKPGIEFLKYNEETDQLDLVDSPDFAFPADYDFDKTGNPVGGPHPGVRSPWYDIEYKRIGENIAEMAKDQDINPSGSVTQFYNPLVIKQLVDQGARPPIWECELEYDEKTGVPIKLIPTAGGRIKLWCNLDNHGKPPRDNYGAGTDVSGGTGCTPSCLSLWCASTGTKVLEYQNAHIRPHEFAVLCVAICRLFCDFDGVGAKIAWENHGPGTTFGKTMWDDMGYLRVYCAEGDDRFGKRVSDKPGWNPTAQARLALHTNYRQALYLRNARNHSRQALDETLNFKHDGKGSVEHTQYKSVDDPAGGRENHGDVVVADALGWKMIETAARVIDAEEEQIARPGTLAWRREQEAKEQAKSKQLYPNWNSRRRHAAYS